MFASLVFLAIVCLQVQMIRNAGQRELPPPIIVLHSHNGVFEKGDSARMECRTPGSYSGSTIYLVRDGVSAYMDQQTVPSREDTASFELVNLTVQHQGDYRCFYRRKESNVWKDSRLSTPVRITIHDHSLENQSPGAAVFRNVWAQVGMVVGGVVLILIVIAMLWYICKKRAKSQRRHNASSNLWTAFDNNIDNYEVMKRRTLTLSRGLDLRSQGDGETGYSARHSTEFLTDMQLSPRGSQKKPFFITFREQ
ncbi:uncharacterized protein LOC122554904 [Chiloscyllium plagiosum]|uniref:uncharacterized protein LOC122554904 n=1 Tax=Chiloscyllium plagiosum TaxID=36176 RepID=UPI001CB82898|nr:uncharacterized protein LOC122554904 [Chiloscyllium plagiosum]XP_043556229.1 uncharacterized protein LOC122554904 [Chiloscyllium plagiosum]